jgi:RNA polymerase subunit RPABC4/transcription elongation factor Spt4
MTTEYCAVHGRVEAVNDDGIERCPICEQATSTTMEEAVRFAHQETVCPWCHGNPCTCPKPLVISEADIQGVFGHECDQANCPVCHPDMTSTEWAELYERAASPHTDKK